MDTLKNLYRRHRKFILYCIIGVTGATLDFSFYLLFTVAWDWSALVASAVSVSLGIVNNFAWNVLINFKTPDRLLLRFLSFYAVGLAGVGLSVVLIWAGTSAGLGSVISKLISIPIIVVVQFALNVVVTFRNKKQHKESAIA